MSDSKFGPGLAHLDVRQLVNDALPLTEERASNLRRLKSSGQEEVQQREKALSSLQARVEAQISQLKTEAEVEISQIRLEAETQILRHKAGVEAKALQLKAELYSSTSELDMLKDKLYTVEALVSPFQFVPDDVLLEIFFHWWDGEDSGGVVWLSDDAVHIGPLNLGLTCRRWYSFISQQPRFWSHISFNMDTDWSDTPGDRHDRYWLSSINRKQLPAIAKQISSMALQKPSFISLDLTMNEDTRLAFKSILGTSGQWRNLAIKSSSDDVGEATCDLRHEFVQGLRSNLRELRSLSIS